MKTITISNDPKIRTLQSAYAVVELKLNQAPKYIKQIQDEIEKKRGELRALYKEDNDFSVDKLFDTEFSLASGLLVKEKKIEKISQEVIDLGEALKQVIISKDLCYEMSDNIRLKLFKAGEPINEYAVSVSIGRDLNCHPFTNESGNVDIKALKGKLSEIFQKYDPSGHIDGYTKISLDDLDDDGYLKSRDYKQDAVYMHFPKEMIESVDEALSEFKDFIVDSIKDNLRNNPNEIPGYELAKMLRPHEIDDYIQENLDKSAESMYGYHIETYGGEQGLIVKRDGYEDYNKRFPFNNVGKLIDVLEPNHQEVYPVMDDRAYPYTTSLSAEASYNARIASIEEFLRYDKKSRDQGMDYVKKLESSLKKKGIESEYEFGW